MTAYTTAEVAEKFETSTRTLRKFLRADARNRDVADTLPGKGGRYSIEGKALKGLNSRFIAWKAEEARKAAERAQENAKAAEAAVADESDIEDEALEELEGPSEDELTEEVTD